MTDKQQPVCLTEHAKAVLEYRDKLAAVLPASVSEPQFIFAVVAECNRLPKECQPKTAVMAAYNLAMIGLVPGSALGHAWIISRKLDRGKPTERTVAEVMPGYKGYVELAFQNNFLKDLHTNVVLQDEEFETYTDRDGPQIMHRPPLERCPSRDNVLAAYCIYHTSRGGTGIRIVPRNELARVDTNRNVWKSDYVAMCRKTSIIRASKEWSVSPRLARAIDLDEQSERGIQQSAEGFEQPPSDGRDMALRMLGVRLDQSIGCTDDESKGRVISWALKRPVAWQEVNKSNAMEILTVLEERQQEVTWDLMLTKGYEYWQRQQENAEA